MNGEIKGIKFTRIVYVLACPAFDSIERDIEIRRCVCL